MYLYNQTNKQTKTYSKHKKIWEDWSKNYWRTKENVWWAQQAYRGFSLGKRQISRFGFGQTILCGGRLFQQFIVDAYTVIEEERLRFIRKKQPQLRADLYKNVHDAVVRGDTSRKSLGKRIVLPATFTGGPRYMIQNYQDAMAIYM